MTPKTLEEFIFNEVCRLSTNELASHVSPTVFEAGTIASKATAAKILKVAEEKSFEIAQYEEIAGVRVGESWRMIRVVNLHDLMQFIQPVKKESEDVK